MKSKNMLARKLLKELVWLAGALIAAILIHISIIGNSARDINLHDTYVFIDGNASHPTLVFYIFTLFIAIAFWVYLVRAFFEKFKENIINLILMVFTGLMIFYLSHVVFYSITMVLSNDILSGHFKNLVLINQSIKFVLILAFGFVGVLTGKNINQEQQ